VDAHLARLRVRQQRDSSPTRISGLATKVGSGKTPAPPRTAIAIATVSSALMLTLTAVDTGSPSTAKSHSVLP
jgi:hypothetical protein